MRNLPHLQFISCAIGGDSRKTNRHSEMIVMKIENNCSISVGLQMGDAQWVVRWKRAAVSGKHEHALWLTCEWVLCMYIDACIVISRLPERTQALRPGVADILRLLQRRSTVFGTLPMLGVSGRSGFHLLFGILH